MTATTCSNRLKHTRTHTSRGRFQQFYHLFLLRLFHEGLALPETDRAPDLMHLLGRVPYLNGSLFSIHDLEQNNPKISIPDEAFEKIFNFFDDYLWNLDWRPSKQDNEINPDVLGYIFEKYVNQKQMGAYYTKEDITGYISRNTVIPFLFSAAKKEWPGAFAPEGSVWSLLRDNPDRYIYPTVGHGLAWNCTRDGTMPLNSPYELPEEIAAGVGDVSKRGEWNKSAPSKYALPTETWREVVARRHRYDETKSKIKAGEIHDVNDLITLNLDIERFAKDVVVQSEGPELLRAFWNAISGVSIMDPTCGSGAFLFAALNILEPLYIACLEGMQGFLDDLERSQQLHNLETLNSFQVDLDRVKKHPNRQHYVLKSIIVNNLYGVDIMEEAVEICKLRLFLKLMAQLKTNDQIEPLPDIDFNIRSGNTLVGFTSLDDVLDAMLYAKEHDAGQRKVVLLEDERKAMRRIKKEADATSLAFNKFRKLQTAPGGVTTAADKTDLRRRLDCLRDELDRYLAIEYGVHTNNMSAYRRWRASHLPFHWFVEFYEIMQRGGFDVIIGNPPYLEFHEVDYGLRGYTCLDTGAIHALCIERSSNILNKWGGLSMIVPLALPSTQRMKPVQDILEQEERSVWYANFAWRPAKLFDTVNRALTVFVAAHSSDAQSLSTGYQKWTSEGREDLLDRIRFARVPRSRKLFWIPKISMDIESSILNKILLMPTSVKNFTGQTGHRIFYRTTGGLYWKVFTNFAPVFFINDQRGKSSRETCFSVQTEAHVRPLIAALSSDVFWWWYTITSNLRDLNPVDVKSFPIPMSIFSDSQLQDLAERYLQSIMDNSTMLTRQQMQTGKTETQSFKIQKSKSIIEEIDRVLAKYYNFTDEELDFIINYDIKYRMGIATRRSSLQV